MFSILSGRSGDTVKLPNHTVLYGVVLAALGGFIALGSLTRLYELREFFPLKLPEQVNELILSYVPFILGIFITTVASLAGLIVGLNWLFGGLRNMARLRVTLRQSGDYFRPENVSLGLKEGKLRTYDSAASLIFWLIGKIWSNARYISDISAEIVRWNSRFIWKALALGIVIHFFFKSLALLPPYLSGLGLGAGYVIPSPVPFYNLLIIVCVIRIIMSFSLIPVRKPSQTREMDSMIVEGKGHPSVFFAILEEGAKTFAREGFSNRISRSKATICEDGETLIGTLIESFPAYVKSSCKPAALISLFLGSVMILVGFLQLILMQYPSFSVGYEDFFRLYLFSLAVDILMNVALIVLGKGFLEQARALMAVYRFRSSLVYVEAKGDFERKVLPDLKGIVPSERLFNPLTQCAFNVRFFSAEAISEAITPEGVRELVGIETSGRLAKDVRRLKFLPFQINFVERYPSSWSPDHEFEEDEERVIAAGEATIGMDTESPIHAAATTGACR